MRTWNPTYLLLVKALAAASLFLVGCTGIIRGGNADPGPDGPDAGAEELPPADQAALTGIVNNPVTGLPVVGATIYIDDAVLGSTDEEGRFHITGLRAGTVSLRAAAGEGACVVASEESSTTLSLGVLASEDLDLVNPGAIVKKVLVLNFDPFVSGQRLHEARGWADPRALTESYVEDLLYCSGNRVFYDVVEWQDVDGIPRKQDGYQYTIQGFLDVLDGKVEGHQPDTVDYLKLVTDYALATRVDAGEIDEVLMWGAPYFGYWESQMVGPGAYWVNSGPIEYASNKKFIIMGLNYERDVAEALHSYGHRSESIMSHVFGGWDSANPTTEWDRFAAYDGQHPGGAGCGNIHWPPNATSDYDYANTRQVSSICDSFHGGSGMAQSVSRETWEYHGDYSRGYLRWWYSHIPSADDLANGKEKNWWKYLADFNGYAASR